MAWRQLVDRQTAGNQDRKRAMKRIADARTPVGILGYHGADPVAWCSIAPRASYRPLGGDEYLGVAVEKIWSIVCFYVPRALRGRGS